MFIKIGVHTTTTIIGTTGALHSSYKLSYHHDYQLLAATIPIITIISLHMYAWSTETAATVVVVVIIIVSLFCLSFYFCYLFTRVLLSLAPSLEIIAPLLLLLLWKKEERSNHNKELFSYESNDETRM